MAGQRQYEPTRSAMLFSFIALLLLLVSSSSVYAFGPLLLVPSMRHENQMLKRNNFSPTTPPPMRRTSQLQVSSLVDVSSVMTAVDAFYVNFPYEAAFLTCGMKASAADLVAQKRQLQEDDDDNNNNNAYLSQKSSEDEIEVPRNIAFLLYGALYQGMAQEFIYNHIYPSWFGASGGGGGSDISIVLTEAFFDIFIHGTLVTLPMAYLVKAVIFQYPLTEGLRRYVHDVRYNGLLQSFFTLWCPVQLVTFGVVPEQYRVAFVALVSFFWIIIFSTISSSSSQEQRMQEE